MTRTRAIEELHEAGAVFSVHEYEVEGSDASYGELVAGAIGASANRVFKTLIASVDGDATVGIVPVTRQLSLKALARAAGGKRAQMVEAKDAERMTGYVVGGISPFGRRKKLPVFIDESALEYETVYVSGGQRGIQIELEPRLLLELVPAKTAPIAT